MAFTMGIVQLHSLRNEIGLNTKKHERIIMKASEHDVDILVFPELSLTGYERELAGSQTFSLTDQRLNELARISKDHNMIVVVGVPYKKESLYIASLVLMPDGTRKVYCKNNLHEGEEDYFTSGTEPVLLEVKKEKIALGICYDIEVEAHFERLVKKATLYIGSIFYSPEGMIGLKEKVKTYSRTYGVDVAVSNFVGTIWDNRAGGRSLCYSQNGECVFEATTDQESLIVCSKDEDVWSSKIISI